MQLGCRRCACNAVGLQHVCMQCSVTAAGVSAMQGEQCRCACNAVGLQRVCMQCRVIGEGVHALQGELRGCACNAG